MLYYFVEFAGSFANIALLLLFIGRLFPKKEPVSKWFYVYVVLMIAGQCALSLFPDWVTQRTIYLLVSWRIFPRTAVLRSATMAGGFCKRSFLYADCFGGSACNAPDRAAHP